MSSRKTARRTWLRLDHAAVAGLFAFTALGARALEYREEFDHRGRPPSPPGHEWAYRDELSPVAKWEEIVPGDGYAYLSAEHEFMKRGRWPWQFWPFQSLEFGPVCAGHRLSMRAKNVAIPGLAAMIFTYCQNGGIDEIDLEITATDTESRDPHHKTGPDGGWTDLRMATWIGADETKPEPATLLRHPATGPEGEARSLQDGEFHVYAIEWDRTEVRFFIDDVRQTTVTTAVPDQPASVIFGLRQMPWAGRANWREPQTMTVDWFTIEPLRQP